MFLLLGSHFLFDQAKQDRPPDPSPSDAAARPSTQPSSTDHPAGTPDQASTLEMVYRVGNGVSAPQELYAPVPEFPEKPSKKWKKQKPATVKLSLVVTSEGRVRDLKVIESTSQDLEKATVATVSQWTFKPGIKDGKPVAVQTTVEVDYRLYDGGSGLVF